MCIYAARARARESALTSRREFGVFRARCSSSSFFLSPALPAFHCKQHTGIYTQPPGRTHIAPEPGAREALLPLARRRAPPLISRSVQIYYCIDPGIYLFHSLRAPFVPPRRSSFYILAASAKQLMCTECVDSNCLAIVAPSRHSRARCTPSRAGEGDSGSSYRVQSPRGSSVRFFPTLCDKSTLLPLPPSSPPIRFQRT